MDIAKIIIFILTLACFMLSFDELEKIDISPKYFLALNMDNNDTDTLRFE